ncbi:hypothetical protein D3C72_2463890 [compost metagenome]
MRGQHPLAQRHFLLGRHTRLRPLSSLCQPVGEIGHSLFQRPEVETLHYGRLGADPAITCILGQLVR